jgi:hypothetical protein
MVYILFAVRFLIWLTSLSVLAAITSAQQRLKLYNRVPPNGLVRTNSIASSFILFFLKKLFYLVFIVFSLLKALFLCSCCCFGSLFELMFFSIYCRLSLFPLSLPKALCLN